MELTLRLRLPTDAASIPLVRRVFATALGTLGADTEDRADIELAITEACTNVLDHAGESAYEVVCSVEGEWCRIRVLDRGAGFDPARVRPAGTEDESGRGLRLLQALVDRVRFEPRAEQGTVVALEKHVHFGAGTPGAVVDPVGEAPR